MFTADSSPTATESASFSLCVTVSGATSLESNLDVFLTFSGKAGV